MAIEGKKTGRPSDYTRQLGERIAGLVACSTLGLKHICDLNDDIPDRATIYRWLETNEEFRDLYARSKAIQLELIAEEMLDIADDGSNDLMTIVKGNESYEMENKEVTNRSRLRVDTRKWLLAKLAPKKYGDRVDVTSAGEKMAGPVIQIVKPD